MHSAANIHLYLKYQNVSLRLKENIMTGKGGHVALKSASPQVYFSCAATQT